MTDTHPHTLTFKVRRCVWCGQIVGHRPHPCTPPDGFTPAPQSDGHLYVDDEITVEVEVPQWTQDQDE